MTSIPNRCQEPLSGRWSERALTRRKRGRPDEGFTLVEILVALVLLSTIVVAVLGAVRMNVRASGTATTAARVESAVVNVADRVNRAPKVCDYAIYAQAAVLSEGWPASTVSVEQWHYVYSAYSPNPSASGSWASGACNSALTAPPALLVQKIRVTVTSPDGNVSRRVEVVKSDV